MIITFKVVADWFKTMIFSLESVRISRLHCVLSLCGIDSANTVIDRLRFVRHLTLEDSVGISLEFEQPNLVYLCHNSPQDDMDKFLETNYAKGTIQTLILSHCPRNIRVFLHYPKLKHLRIIQEVEFGEKLRLELVKEWTTLDVHLKEVQQPEECNLILELTNACLIEILSYLCLDDWLMIEQINGRFKSLVRTHMLPEANLIIDYRFLSRHKNVLHRLGPRAKSLVLKSQSQEALQRFTHLQSLTLEEDLIDAVADLIPSGLQKLKLKCNWGGTDYQGQLFQRLAPTLKVLHMNGFDGLEELNNVVELNASGMELNYQLGQFLCLNRGHLEILRLRFYHRFRRFVRPSYKILLGELPCLRVLHLTNLHYYIEICNEDFPCLVELHLAFYCGRWGSRSEVHVGQMLADVANLKTLRQLELNLNGTKWNSSVLYSLINLRRLAITDVDNQSILDIVDHLENLQELGLPKDFYSLEFEGQLRSILFNQKKSMFLYRINRALPHKILIEGAQMQSNDIWREIREDDEV